MTESTTSTRFPAKKWVYPTIRRDESVFDELHGIKIQDPYRHLENPAAEETKQFVKDQNKLFYETIESYPKRQNIKEGITKMINYERYGCPFKRGDNYYYNHNAGLQPQFVMYKQTSLDAKPTVFFDPNKLSEDGTISLNTYGFSKSGKYFAYGLSQSGSDWVTIHVKETVDGGPEEFEPEPIKWAKFTRISWTHDDKGFFYLKYPSPSESLANKDAGTETDSNKNAKIYYHKLGTSQSEDFVIYEDPEHPDYTYSSEVSDDGEYLVLSVNDGCDPANKLYVAKIQDLMQGSKTFNKLIDVKEAEYEYITNDGSIFYFQTTKDAPRRKIVKVSLEMGVFETIVPQTEDVLEFSAVVDQNKLILAYLHHVKHVVRIHDLETSKLLEDHQPHLPMGCVIQSLSCRREDKTFFYSFASFVSPGTIYHYDCESKNSKLFQEIQVPSHNSEDYEIKQEFFASKDGTKVPMFIISRKDDPRSPDTPTLLYGYGGFNVSITPYFSVAMLAFVKHFHGRVVIANIRGGGEYGEDWNKGGKLHKKQNVFDDFQHAAMFLINQGYTSAPKLAINGGSNGGLLVAACTNQRPDLFGCAVADVGVMDLLRFGMFTIGHAWSSDYGVPRDSKADFDVNIKYSPLHNVRSDVVYPPYLLTTSDHDDRVVPLHSFKLLAELQHRAKDNPNPILIRIETKAGHGAGKSTQQRIEESTDKYSFMALALGATWHD